eukprot:317261_1
MVRFITLYLWTLLFGNINAMYIEETKIYDDIDVNDVEEQMLNKDSYYVSIINLSMIIIAFGMVCVTIILCVLCRKHETNDSMDIIVVTPKIHYERTPLNIHEFKYQSFDLMT